LLTRFSPSHAQLSEMGAGVGHPTQPGFLCQPCIRKDAWLEIELARLR